ncbi:hypothetical protein FLGSB24_30260 [Flavobacterium sp. GSB-24]|nr:hypothetical protein FLGSB24_30260 [Flavobacterium sp. GSB-24]
MTKLVQIRTFLNFYMLQIATKFKIPCFTEGSGDGGLGRFWVYSEFSAGWGAGKLECGGCGCEGG